MYQSNPTPNVAALAALCGSKRRQSSDDERHLLVSLPPTIAPSHPVFIDLVRDMSRYDGD